MSRSKSTKELVLQVTDSLFSTVTDMVLGLTYFIAEHSIPRREWGDIDYRVMQHLEHFNSSTIKTALKHLSEQGHISSSKIKIDKLPRITPEGIEKIRRRLPQYKTHRPWDKSFYLISYDLPTVRNADRNYLRQMIKLLGCVRLQHSTWLTPYHPKTFLPENLDAHNLNHIIAISKLDTTTGIGSTNMPKLIQELYPLEKLNQRYQKFISTTKTSRQPLETAFTYWQILRDDPQLPFELLPKDWLGDQAYKLFHQTTGLI